LMVAPTTAKGLRMNEGPRPKLSREDRLAAKLRENLRRRKTQARSLSDSDPATLGGPPIETLPNRLHES
jgi:hypothetical protein